MKKNMDRRVRAEDRLRSPKRSERCSALMKQRQPKNPVTSIARPICKTYAMLFEIFENTDYTKSRICALENEQMFKDCAWYPRKFSMSQGYVGSS